MHYTFPTMTEIVLAGCILHNFFTGIDPAHDLIAEVDQEFSQHLHNENVIIGQYKQGELLRIT